MNGVQAADIIYRRRKIPIRFISAYTYEEIGRHGNLPETFDYLSKPIDTEQLTSRLGTIFEEG